jgi:hypothetical protein
VRLYVSRMPPVTPIAEPSPFILLGLGLGVFVLFSFAKKALARKRLSEIDCFGSPLRALRFEGTFSGVTENVALRNRCPRSKNSSWRANRPEPDIRRSRWTFSLSRTRRGHLECPSVTTHLVHLGRTAFANLAGQRRYWPVKGLERAAFWAQ